jgi:hypothetical protein
LSLKPSTMMSVRAVWLVTGSAPGHRAKIELAIR